MLERQVQHSTQSLIKVLILFHEACVILHKLLHSNNKQLQLSLIQNSLILTAYVGCVFICERGRVCVCVCVCVCLFHLPMANELAKKTLHNPIQFKITNKV